VVGFGAAGIAAAITAHDAGAEVVILEKQPEERAGGNTRVSGNVWFTPTNATAAASYLRGLCGDFPVPEAVIEAWAAETAQNTSWILARIEESRELVVRDDRDPCPEAFEPGHTPYARAVSTRGVPAADERGHEDGAYEFPELPGHEADDGYHHIGPTQGFSRLWLTLRACVLLRGIPVLYGTRARSLVQGLDGTVRGVLAEADGAPLALGARRGVVLASGGFENDQALVREHLRLPGSVPYGSPGNTGDGLRIAQKAGAGLWHMANFAGVPGLAIPGYEAGAQGAPKGDAWILVADDGRRFIDETIPYAHGKSMIGGRYQLHPDRVMHVIFDESARRAGPVVLPYALQASGWLKVIDRYEWSADNIPEIERGWIARGDTPAELAGRLGIDAAGLELEVDAYNTACAAGADRLERPAETLVPLREPPFYGYSWGPLILYTCGGPQKDGRARVLDALGVPIPRLYCAGEVSSTYSWCMSGGQMIGDALAFGRIAGRDVVRSSAR
jgi:succinate dehydrogenase/fumarate reductase flavoprotein subunit